MLRTCPVACDQQLPGEVLVNAFCLSSLQFGRGRINAFFVVNYENVSWGP